MRGRLSCTPLSKQHRWGYGRLSCCRKARAIVLVLAVAFLLSGGYLWAANGEGVHIAKGQQNVKPAADSGQVRYSVFSLRHISAERGKEYLAEAKIGTASKLPGVNMLLVTAQPRELIKAAAVLELVDAEEQFVIRTVLPALSAGDYPSDKKIPAKVGDVTIGTFSDPPRRNAVPRAIIDVHNDAVMIIAPSNQVERIVSAMAQNSVLQEDSTVEVQPPRKTEAVLPHPAEPNKVIEPGQTEGPEAKLAPGAQLEELEFKTPPSEFAGQADLYESESDELFSRLLDSLAEAEKKAAEQAKQVREANEPKTITPEPEPDEPNVVVTLPEPNLPSERSVGLEKPDQQLAGIALGEILKRLEALEAAAKAEPVPKREPYEIKEVVLEIEQPNEVSVEEAVPGIGQPNEVSVEEAAPEIEQPNEVDIIEVVPRIEQPNEVDAEEMVPEIEQPNEVDIEEVAPKVEPPNEVAVEEVAPKIERPSEVNEIGEANEVVEPGPPGEEVIMLNLPEKLSMTTFLGFMGEYLKLDYLYNPAEVKGDVTLRIHGDLKGPIKVSDLYHLLQQVLQFNDFVMTRDRNLVLIRKKQSADIINPDLVPLEGGEVETGDVVITRFFELNHVDTASATNLLIQMKFGIGEIKQIPDTGTLIVTEYTHRMPRVEELLEVLDKPGEPKQFRFRPLQYTMAANLAPKIKTLVEQLGEISVTVAQTAQPTPARDPRRPPRRGKATPKPPAAAAPQKPGVYLDFDERTNRILMIGYENELRVVEELITRLDVEQQDLRALRLYQIRHVDAEEVRKKLEELGIVGGVAAGRDRRDRRAERITQATKPGQKPPPAAPRTTATTEQAPLVEEPQVVIIETVNALLVNATREQHIQIATIIGYVDTETPETDIPYVVYPLENQAPEELAAVLNSLIQETTSKQDKEGKIVKTVEMRLEEDIIIIAEPKTYSLIVYASKKNQQWIGALIRKLDEYRPQVLLDVSLVEVTRNEEFSLDLDLVSKFPSLSPGGVMENPFFSALLEPFPDKRITEVSSISGAGGQAFYADEHIQALLTAMHRKGYGRILARPKLLVNDNEEGTIKTQENKPIVSVETKVIPATGVSSSTAAPSIKIDTYTAGITLTITPHISKGDQLRLTITLTRTDFRLNEDYSLTAGTGSISGPTPPDLLTSDVATVVTVPDSKTIILGGLERLSQSKGGTKVPFLGDIPLIGGLFRNTSNLDAQSRLYVFVKAHILRPGEETTGVSDIELVSAKNQATFEKYEEEMQKYEDWPGIKPKPMDPVRILNND